MSTPTTTSNLSIPGFDLSAADVILNPSVEQLYQDCVSEGDVVSSNGAIVAYTGRYTGRTPKDKFIVRTPSFERDIWWENNHPMDERVFAALKAKANSQFPNKKLYVIDTFAGADPKYQIAVRFIVERAYHALFVHQLLIRPSKEQLKNFEPDWTVVDLCRTVTDPEKDEVRSEATIALNFQTQKILIFGTQYAGELKKSIFSVMNYLLPTQGVMSMHCSANIGKSGDVALFFGLSGTGKTTLSADPNRCLIGDDEHGWSDSGVFNIEGGCYAKCINLSRKGEPEIWDAIKHGSVLENVILDKSGTPDYTNVSLTENTRCAYPLEYIPSSVSPSIGSHPKNIFFLTCDAMGVLPPISKLTLEQASDMFLIGYTAKVAGTEVGVSEPVPSFSACFALPFLPLTPTTYSKLLIEKIKEHKTTVWLLNTGWTGGPYGTGKRIDLKYTRAMLDAVLSGKLDSVEFKKDPFFGFSVAQSCPGVPSNLLNPDKTWADQQAYDAAAKNLKSLFETHKNPVVIGDAEG